MTIKTYNNPNLIEEEEKEEGSNHSEDGRAEVDSLLNTPLSDYPMSDIEEDQQYIEKIKDKGIEYESDGSQESDIPEEHENGYGHNEYMRRYLLNMKTMTWN